jgi:hypothetical protein
VSNYHHHDVSSTNNDNDVMENPNHDDPNAKELPRTGHPNRRRHHRRRNCTVQ